MSGNFYYNYLSSTVAPASLNFASIAFASSAGTFSLIVEGAPSTRAFASESPSPVASRAALITWILFGPTSLRTTVNSVFSSAAGAAAPPATGAATAAAALTPNSSSSFFTSSLTSISESFLISSTRFYIAILIFSFLISKQFILPFNR